LSGSSRLVLGICSIGAPSVGKVSLPEVALTTDDRSYFAIEHVALEEGAAVIALHGELDALSSGELRSTLGLLGLVFGAVVVDLSNLVFCDSRGLLALRDTHEHLRATHGRLTLRRPPRLVRRLFGITGLDEVLDVERGVIDEYDGVGR
jgi:anti-sigma B factor antagonist